MTKKRLLLVVPITILALAGAVLGLGVLTSTKAKATGDPCCYECPSCYTDRHNINCCDVYTGVTLPVGTANFVNCHDVCYDDCYNASCSTECCTALGMWDVGTTPRPGIIW